MPAKFVELFARRRFAFAGDRKRQKGHAVDKIFGSVADSPYALYRPAIIIGGPAHGRKAHGTSVTL